MPRLSAIELHRIAEKILRGAGATEANARRVADSLVSAHVSGVDTHGVWHLPMYVAHIKQGWIVPTAVPAVVRETPVSALVTGNWTFGHVATKHGVDVAVGKAADGGVAVVGVVQTHHNGRLGEYMEMAAARGMIGLIFGGGQGRENPVSVPYGGRRPLLSTNPFAMGFPCGDGPPFIMDIATTATSGSKVMLARDRGEAVAPGLLIDRDGNPTTDPAAFFEGGGLTPFGAHKGYGLMLAVELMGRVFTGADALADPTRGGPYMRYQGVTIVTIRADLFQDLPALLAGAADLAHRVRTTPAAPGFDRVLMPGDLEARTRAERTRDGVEIPDGVWKSLMDLAASLGVEDVASARGEGKRNV